MAKSKKNNVTSNESVSSDDQINDVSQAEVKKLISKGKEKGYLTYEEISGTGLAHIRNGIILPPKYEAFKFLNRAFIEVYDEEMNRSLFDTMGVQILPNGFERINIESNFIWGKRSGKWGAYDRQGKVILPHAVTCTA